MTHYAKLDAMNVIFGYTFSDAAPSPEWTEVDADISQAATASTFHRLVDGVPVDIGQPKLPPAAWMSWSVPDMAWVDSRDLGQLKSDKWEEIKAARSAAEYGGFVWDGSTFDSDAASQQKIIGASQMASLNPASFEVDWTLADNTVRTLNAADMNAVGIALGQHVNAQYVHARTLRQQIEDATTKAEIEAVVW